MTRCSKYLHRFYLYVRKKVFCHDKMSETTELVFRALGVSKNISRRKRANECVEFSSLFNEKGQ